MELTFIAFIFQDINISNIATLKQSIDKHSEAVTTYEL